MNNEFSDITKKDSKLKFIIIGVLLVVAVLIGLYFGYKKLYNKDPKSIFERALEDVYNYASKELKEVEKENIDVNVLTDPVVYDFDINVKSNMEELKFLEGLNLKAKTGLDYKNEITLLNANIMQNNEKLIDADLLLDKNVIYLKSSDLLDKVVKLNEVDFSSILDLDDLTKLNIDTKDLDRMLKELKDILIKSLDSGKFTSEKTTIKIDNKDVKVTKNDYLMDKENAKRTYEFLCDEIVKNDKILDFIAAFTESSKEELKTNITDSKKTMDYSNFENVYITLYTKGINNIVSGEVKEKNTTLIKFDNLDKLAIDINLEEIKIKITEQDDLYEVVINESNTEVANLKLKKDKFDVEFIIKVDNEEYKGSIALNSKKENAKKVSGDMKITFSGKVEEKDVNFEANVKYTMEQTNFEIFDTASSVDASSLTEEDTTKLSTKLMEILGKLNIEI